MLRQPFNTCTPNVVAHLLTSAKLLLLAPLVLVAAAFVLCLVLGLAPFATLYFSFARFCDLIEEFKPGRKRTTSKGNRLAKIQKFLSYLPAKK
jgi:hypothetical protein